MVANPPCNTGDSDLIPGGETKLSRATEQLIPCAATTEPANHKLESSCTSRKDPAWWNEDPNC